MSERTTGERVEPQFSAFAPQAGPPSPSVKLGSQTLRFDGPEPAAPATTPFAHQAKQFSEFTQMVLQTQQHMEDIARREQHLTQQKTEFEHEMRQFRLWSGELEAELADRKTAQHASESALAQRLTEFERQQRELELTLERVETERQELERDRTSLRAELQQELDRDRQALAAERHTLEVQQRKVQELGDALLEQHRTQQTKIDQQLQQEREQLWITLNTEWEEKRTQFERDKAEFLKDRTLLETRLRFQQDHLEKTMAELEAEQQEAVQEEQAIRQQLEFAEQQLQRRKTQLDQYRETLEELERALERETELHSRLKAAISSSAEQEHQHYLVERTTWEEERRQQQAELRRQQEILLTHTENLETRRLRLESLRREVEETNHATLELRLAVEEVWAQLQQAVGLSVAQEQVDAAKLAVSRNYEQWQARLWEQRRELHEAERHFEQQRLAFQEERRTLTDWIAARDEELLRQERQQREQSAEQVEADQSWQVHRDRWLAERAEAEQVIRRLLHDLLERTGELPEPDASALAAPQAA